MRLMAATRPSYVKTGGKSAYLAYVGGKYVGIVAKRGENWYGTKGARHVAQGATRDEAAIVLAASVERHRD
jgi:hypothetical protein